MSTKLDGVNIHVANKAWIERTACLHVAWARIDINWNAVEPSEGKYNWSAIDTLVSSLNAANIKVYATLAYSPAWAAKTYKDVPANVNTWINFCQTAAQRYGTKIAVYSIWNEPNSSAFFTGTLDDYLTKILRPAYIAIKSINNKLQVAAGEIAYANSNWPKWLDALDSDLQYFDIFAMHCYKSSASAVKNRFTVGKLPPIGWLIPKYQPINNHLKKIHAAKRPVFFTETGLKANVTSESAMEKQRTFVKQIVDYKKDMDVDVVFIYDLHDNANESEKWGLYAADGSPKLAAAMLI